MTTRLKSDGGARFIRTVQSQMRNAKLRSKLDEGRQKSKKERLMAEIELFRDRLTLESIDPDSPLGVQLTVEWAARSQERFVEPDFRASFSEGFEND